ncbi:hypothetical protein [Hydrogenophaga sp. PAMC20947]|uniref:lipopolysaccharide biosynthesis protein n=1 Tax=Hydrogenophaga sp. PAMC20947 TaxID=2565558 RepID=UPI00109DDF15|nr:hypothetical protein [Hydrogenophaga sp. PAMC20947]QCB47788.1 hypothetical protein E5678_18180 [Hydrogenophaga sp. PAMC20947]
MKELFFFPKNGKLLKALSTSIINQGLSSVSNFAFGIYLVKELTPSDFGFYGIALAISLFLAGLGNSVFLTQMVVNFGDKEEDDRLPYLARMLAGLTLFSIVLVSITFILFLITSYAFQGENLQTISFFSTAIASLGFLYKDFFIRKSYTLQKESNAVIINAWVAMSMLAIVFSLKLLKIEINSNYALLIYGGSNAIGAIIGFTRSEISMKNLEFGKILIDAKESWRGGGGWYVLVTIANAIQTQAHTITGALLMGPIGVATMNAAKLYLTPPFVLLPAINQVILPRMVAQRKNILSTKNTGYAVSLLLIFVTLAYIAPLVFFFEPISKLLTSGKYEDLDGTMYGWCFAALMVAARSGAALHNHAIKQFKKFFYASAISGFFSIIISFILINIYGPIGGPIGLGLGEIVVIIILTRSNNKVAKDNQK